MNTLDRLAPLVAGILITALLIVGAGYLAHELSTVLAVLAAP